MNEELIHTQQSVRAIWNRDRTLKICLGEDITQAESICEYMDSSDNGESERCDARAWPQFNGPIVVSGDGVAHFCEDCVRETDPAFADAYEKAFSLVVTEEGLPCLDDWMDKLAAHIPPSSRGEIEYVPKRGGDPQ